MAWNVQQWRGVVFAEATFKIGACYYDQKLTEKAFPYFEAAYVRYGRYTDWAAQGYLYHAKCLKALGHGGDATNVLREAISNPQIKGSKYFTALNQEL